MHSAARAQLEKILKITNLGYTLNSGFLNSRFTAYDASPRQKHNTMYKLRINIDNELYKENILSIAQHVAELGKGGVISAFKYIKPFDTLERFKGKTQFTIYLPKTINYPQIKQFCLQLELRLKQDGIKRSTVFPESDLAIGEYLSFRQFSLDGTDYVSAEKPAVAQLKERAKNSKLYVCLRTATLLTDCQNKFNLPPALMTALNGLIEKYEKNLDSLFFNSASKLVTVEKILMQLIATPDIATTEAFLCSKVQVNGKAISLQETVNEKGLQYFVNNASVEKVGNAINSKMK